MSEQSAVSTVPAPSNVFALARTHLANQRTCLAYFRTANGLFAAAVASIKLIDIPMIEVIAGALAFAGALTVVLGIRDFVRKRRIIRVYAQEFVGDAHLEF